MRLWLPVLAVVSLLSGCASVSVPGKSDIQYNYFSDSNGVTSLYEGGPHPVSAPWPGDNQFLPDNPVQYSAILKISDGTSNLTPGHLWVASGNQDSVNLNNHASGNVLSGDAALNAPAGLRVLTIKGGSNDNRVALVIHSHGTSEDVKIGDWSDQTYNYSVHNDISGISATDGKKVNVVLMHARGTKLGKSEHVLILKSIEGKAYWWFKWAVREVLGIPVGTPGPKWLS